MPMLLCRHGIVKTPAFVTIPDTADGGSGMTKEASQRFALRRAGDGSTGAAFRHTPQKQHAGKYILVQFRSAMA